MNTNPTIAELAAEVTDLVDRCGATEFQLQELIDADLACRLDDTQSTVDDLEYRLTETESQLAGLADQLGDLEPIEVNNYFDNLFVRTKQLEEKLVQRDVHIESLENRLARLEGQSFLARLFRKGVK